MQIQNNKLTESRFGQILSLAVPISLQSMVQTSFSMIDQLMICKLGSPQIAAVGIAGKFLLIYNIAIGAVSVIAGIMIAQYLGANDKDSADRSMNLNLLVTVAAGAVFFVLSLLVPSNIIRLYTKDTDVILIGSRYLKIISLSFIPLSVTAIVSVMLRCKEKVRILMVFSFTAAIINTILNYCLIFGNFGFPVLGEKGAAAASVISVAVQTMLCVGALIVSCKKNDERFSSGIRPENISAKQYVAMLAPVLFTDVLWSLGENVYMSVYGHIGTDSLAAMAMVTPVISLVIAAFTGFSMAGAIICGKNLGKKDFGKAYEDGKLTLLSGFVFSVVVMAALIPLRSYILKIYSVTEELRSIGSLILLVFLIYVPLKILNLIGGSGIIRSGGHTKPLMIIGTACTWCVGIPLALVSAFVLELPMSHVYAILSAEEIVRFAMIIRVFRGKGWMHRIGEQETGEKIK